MESTSTTSRQGAAAARGTVRAKTEVATLRTQAPVRSALVGAFRSTWVSTPFPIVVEHHADGGHRICSAPSLWMGARERAHALRDAGLGPGDRLAATLPAGIAFVQWLVACLRAGVTFVPCGALAGVPAHAAVRSAEQLVPERLRRAPEDAPARALVRSGMGWERLGDAELEGAAAQGVLGALEPGQRAWSGGSWRERRSLLGELVPLLAGGCEVHVGLTPGRLPSLPDVRPELVVGPSDRIIGWLEGWPEWVGDARLVALESLGDGETRAAA